MQVLLLKKETSSALQRESLTALQTRKVLPKMFLERIELADMEHTDTIAKVRGILTRAGYQIEEIYPDDPLPNTKFTYVVTVGGDGTVLDASHLALPPETAIIGVRSSRGSVGKLCTFDYQNLAALTSCLQNGNINSVELKRLHAIVTCNRAGTKTVTNPVLNDFLFTNANPAATTRYILNYNDDWECHKSSGVWVSTATGSSAAIGAAGGEPMNLTNTNFQFRVRELYYSSGHGIKGEIFNPEQHQLAIYSVCDQALLSLDGHHRAVPIAYGDSIEFTPASSIKIVLKERL